MKSIRTHPEELLVQKSFVSLAKVVVSKMMKLDIFSGGVLRQDFLFSEGERLREP